MNARLLLRCYEDSKDLYERCHCAGVQKDICDDLKSVRNALRDLVIEEMETGSKPAEIPVVTRNSTAISHEPNWVYFDKLKKDLPGMFEEVE